MAIELLILKINLSCIRFACIKVFDSYVSSNQQWVSVGSSQVTGCKCQSQNLISIPLTFSLKCQDFLFLRVSSYLSAVACYEDFPLVRCTSDEFVFIFNRIVYKFNNQMKQYCVFTNKTYQLPFCCRRYLILIALIHLASPICPICYLIQGAAEQSPTLSFLIRKEPIVRKLLSYALIQDDEFDSLANFKSSYLTCVVLFFFFLHGKFDKCLSSSIVVSVREGQYEEESRSQNLHNSSG